MKREEYAPAWMNTEMHVSNFRYTAKVMALGKEAAVRRACSVLTVMVAAAAQSWLGRR
jgi:hypothetical protein